MRWITSAIVAAISMVVLATGAQGAGQSPGAPQKAGQDPIGPLDIVCTTYFVSGPCTNPTYGSETSNNWKLSGSYARRYHHYVWTPNQANCLPSYAFFEVANFAQDGSKINSHVSPLGACFFGYELTSNGLYAKAGCRIVSQGAQVTRQIACQTEWN